MRCSRTDLSVNVNQDQRRWAIIFTPMDNNFSAFGEPAAAPTPPVPRNPVAAMATSSNVRKDHTVIMDDNEGLGADFGDEKRGKCLETEVIRKRKEFQIVTSMDLEVERRAKRAANVVNAEAGRDDQLETLRATIKTLESRIEKLTSNTAKLAAVTRVTVEEKGAIEKAYMQEVRKNLELTRSLRCSEQSVDQIRSQSRKAGEKHQLALETAQVNGLLEGWKKGNADASAWKQEVATYVREKILREEMTDCISHTVFAGDIVTHKGKNYDSTNIATWMSSQKGRVKYDPFRDVWQKSQAHRNRGLEGIVQKTTVLYEEMLNGGSVSDI